MTLVKYFEVGRITLLNSLQYRMDFFANASFIALIIFVFSQLWQTVYSVEGKVIAGFTLPMMIWYLLTTESIVTASGRVVEKIGDEIQSGTIVQYLNKPYNYIFFEYSSNIAQSILRFFVTFIVGGILVFFLIGPISINFNNLIPVFLTIVLALSIHFLIMAFLGVFAIWLEDSKALNFIYNKVTFVFGGMLLPLDLFPEWLAKISSSMPFSYIAYYPAKLAVNFSWKDFLFVVLGQIFWLALIITLIFIAYKICFRRLSINGG
jgi:ABC-2 type transport system permease protein